MAILDVSMGHQRAAALARLFEKQRQRSAQRTEQGEDAKVIYKRQQSGLVQERAHKLPHKPAVFRGTLSANFLTTTCRV
jgi:hypothetical protein